MSLLQRGLMFVLAAGTLVLPSSVPPETRAGGRAAVTVDPQTVSVYTPADKEYYLDEAQMDFIRPGLKVIIGTVTDMAPGKKPIVEVTMTDQFDMPLDRLGAKTPGVISLRFIPAVWDAATGRPISEHFRATEGLLKSFRLLKIGLELPREDLYRRIEARVDRMFERGLIEET